MIGNAIAAALVLAAMATLSWQITLASLVLVPLFVLPARSIGRRLQALARKAMDLTGRMNKTMIERFNVAGAQIVETLSDGRTMKLRDSGSARPSCR